MSPQEVKAEKLTAIYRALLDMLAHQPISQIAVSALCSRAGVSRTYFYREYRDYEAIITRYQERAIIGYVRALPDHQTVGLQAAMVGYFQYVQASAAEQRLLVKAGRTTTLIKTFESAFTRLAETNRLIASDLLLKQPYYVGFLAAGVVNVSVHWLDNGMSETPKEMGYYIQRYGYAFH